MKLLVLGLGSMGKRRIRNLQSLSSNEILGFDVRADRRQESEQKYGIRTVNTFEDALREDVDAFIISTPPETHVKYATAAVERNKPFLMEATVVAEGLEELNRKCKEKNLVAAPSCTMRFHPAVKIMKKLLDEGAIGRVLAFTHHCGNYLPDWHPYEDYRSFYAARRQTGAAKEMVPFELVWLTWILGDISEISCLKGKTSSLDADIDDVYQLLLRFANGALGNMLVDVVSRDSVRSTRIVGEKGTIQWSWPANLVRFYKASDGAWEEVHVDEGEPEKYYKAGEKMYIEEMNCFLRAVKREGPYIHSFDDDIRVLNLLAAAERSSKKGTHVRT